MTVNWIDFIVLTVMALSVLFGLWRGVLSAGFGILAILVGFYAAKDYAPLLFPYLQGALGKSPMVRPLSYAVLFLVGLLSVGIVARLIRGSLRKMDFGGLDALGGAVFGVLRGVAFCALLVLSFSAVGIGSTSAWSSSATVPYVGGAIRFVMGFSSLADYRNWLEFDEKNRPLVVDAALPDGDEEDAESPPLDAPDVPAPAPVEGEQTAPADAPAEGEQPVPVDADELQQQSINEALLKGGLPAGAEEWQKAAMGREKLEYIIKGVLLPYGGAAVGEGESESLSEEQWEQIRQILPQGDGADG